MKDGNAAKIMMPPELMDLALDSFLHPAQPYARPIDVLADPDITVDEKREILAAWASDACAIEAAPALRRAPGSAWIVSLEEILNALRALDKQAGLRGSSWARRQVRRAAIEAFRASRGRNNTGSSGNPVH